MDNKNHLYVPPEEKIIKVSCPECNVKVPPTKSPSVYALLILGYIYAIYYYLIKNRHCPLCFHKFKKDELGNYKDPDVLGRVYSIGSILILILVIMVLLT